MTMNARSLGIDGREPARQQPRREKLTQDFLAKLEPPMTGRIMVWDAGCPGFGIRIYALRPGQTKPRIAFIVDYRVGRKQVWETIGTLAVIPKVADARKIAQDRLLRAKLGMNPVRERCTTRHAEANSNGELETEQANGLSLLIVVREFLAYCQRRGLAAGTITLRRLIFWQVIPQLRGRNALHEDALPDWTERPTRGITKEEIEALIEQVGSWRKLKFRGRIDDGAKAQANNTYYVFRTFFRWAKKRGRIDIDPTNDLEPPYPINERTRWLKDDEIRLLWGACVAIKYPFGPIIQLRLLTAQRESEVAGISRIELDMPHSGQWTIRRRTKTTEEGHIVPLSALAREIIESLPQIAGTGLLFTLDGQKPVSGFSSVKRRIDRLMLEQRRQQLLAAGGDPKDATPMPTWRRARREHAIDPMTEMLPWNGGEHSNEFRPSERCRPSRDVLGLVRGARSRRARDIPDVRPVAMLIVLAPRRAPREPAQVARGACDE